MIGTLPMSITFPLSQCVVPNNINGPVAIYITSDAQPLLLDVVDRATTQLVAGPTLAFIDTQPQSLGQLVRNSGSTSSDSGSGSSSSSDSTATDTATASVTTSTATISPAEASALISSAAATPTDGAAAPAQTVNNPAANTTPSGPNLFTGPAPDNSTNVLGWVNLPSQ